MCLDLEKLISSSCRRKIIKFLWKTNYINVLHVPPVAGFFGKFFLFTAAAEKGFYMLVFIAVVNTIISLYYYLLVVKAMFINKNETAIAKFKSDGFTKLGLALCVAGIAVTGFASVIFEVIRSLSFGV